MTFKRTNPINRENYSTKNKEASKRQLKGKRLNFSGIHENLAEPCMVINYCESIFQAVPNILFCMFRSFTRQTSNSEHSPATIGSKKMKNPTPWTISVAARMVGWSRCWDCRILNSYIIRPKKPIRRSRFFIIFTLPCSTCNIAGVCKAYPRRPKSSQSGRKKRRDESFKHGRKSPWVKTLTGASPNCQANAASWLRTKMLCIILPNR